MRNLHDIQPPATPPTPRKILPGGVLVFDDVLRTEDFDELYRQMQEFKRTAYYRLAADLGGTIDNTFTLTNAKNATNT